MLCDRPKDIPEIQPSCRVTATPSQSRIELPPNAVLVSVAIMQMRRREAGQGGGWGCGREQLEATVPCALFTVDVCNGEAHTAFSRVLSRTHGSPGALYLNIII